MIKHVFTAHYSKRDFYGNCYWGFTYTNTANGKSVSGKISGGESNIRAAIPELNGGGWDNNYIFNTQENKIRDFNRMTKEWPYAGCAPAEIAKFCKEKTA